MRTNTKIDVSPISNSEWWDKHVKYSKFRRQGIDIICASFINKRPKANIIFLTGLMESFLKYSEIIEFFFEKGFNVFTYDHQSQGLSGRWLSESQSLWVNTFEDYVDDFVYFVTSLSKDPEMPHSNIPFFLIAHSMGGLISSIAMSRLPSLIQRAVLCSPMLRNKCGTKAMDYKYPLPQPLAYWISYMFSYAGLGTMHSIGFYKERPTDKLSLNVFTSERSSLDKWQAMRMKYPYLISTCVTNDWLVHSIRAQKKFSSRYEFVKTNTLVLAAEIDYLVYNRAMAQFVKKAPTSKMFIVPGAYHELLQENAIIKEATLKVIYDFFNQKSDLVSNVQPCFPIEDFDSSKPIYTWTEVIIRSSGLFIASIGLISGIAMLLAGRNKN